MSEHREKPIAEIAFANVAGGARELVPNPERLGTVLAEKTENLIAVGLSECILSIDQSLRAREQAADLPEHPQDMAKEVTDPDNLAPTVYAAPPLDDLKSVAIGLGGGWLGYYFPHVNSGDCNEQATKMKFTGDEAARRLQDQFKPGRVVYQGLGLLVRARYHNKVQARGTFLRLFGNNGTSQNPRDYQGTRNTEPRTMVDATLKLLDTSIRLAFCQLGTYSGEQRVWTKDHAYGPSVPHVERSGQVERICEQFREVVDPVLLLGDFNARPGTPELITLAEKGKFRHVMPDGWPHGGWGKDYVYGARVEEPVYDTSEEKQGRPFSHLKHGTLIDHAFVRSSGDDLWCSARIVPLDRDVTDHCAIVLSIWKVSQP